MVNKEGGEREERKRKENLLGDFKTNCFVLAEINTPIGSLSQKPNFVIISITDVRIRGRNEEKRKRREERERREEKRREGKEIREEKRKEEERNKRVNNFLCTMPKAIVHLPLKRVREMLPKGFGRGIWSTREEGG